VQTLAQIRELLDQAGLSPKKSLGQNFLIDHNLIRKLVDASGVGPGDTVLEVGPGTGTLTEELLARDCHVVACELDDGLAALNAQRLPTLPGGQRFTLVHGDCLDSKHAINPRLIALLAGKRFALVANLPYGAATPLMSLLLVNHPECRTLAVTIQKEVADRLAAAPSTKAYGALAVIAQASCRVERVALAGPECFWPRPDVTSAMILLRRLERPLTPDLPALSAFCRVIFAQRRKQLGSLIKGVDWNAASGVRPTARAEELSPAGVVALMHALQAQGWNPPPRLEPGPDVG
jgi:16S rRNA (adenine1518-N6/adenine1519-N6)-dimethyltransferase